MLFWSSGRVRVWTSEIFRVRVGFGFEKLPQTRRVFGFGYTRSCTNKYVVEYECRVFADIAKPCLCLTLRRVCLIVSPLRPLRVLKWLPENLKKRSPLSASFPSQQKRPLNYLKKSWGQTPFSAKLHPSPIRWLFVCFALLLKGRPRRKTHKKKSHEMSHFKRIAS